MIGDIYSVAENGKDLILQSKTGSGKTVCSLSALLSYCISNGKKLIYTTRTNSQQNQVISEVRTITEKIPPGTDVDWDTPAVPLQGRRNLCPLMDSMEDFREAVPEELSLMCSFRKKRTTEFIERVGMEKIEPPDPKESQRLIEDKMCPYYLGLLTAEKGELKDWMAETIPTAQEISTKCRQLGICPYEFLKTRLKDSLLTVMPYIYVFNDSIRGHLLEWLCEDTTNIVLVVDEAHNLPDYLRDMYSFTLSSPTVTAARNEADNYGIGVFCQDIKMSDFLDALKNALSDLADDFLYWESPGGEVVELEDAFIPQDSLESALMSSFATTSRVIERGLERMALDGLAIKERKREEGKLPRSYLHIVAAFLKRWTSLTEDYYVKLIYGRKNPQLEGYCLDPQKGGIIARTFHASIHMSGTLAPLPEYRDCLGLGNSILKDYPSPFDPANLRIIYHPDLTTKYSQFRGNEDMVHRFKGEIVAVLNAHRCNTMVFFPSFKTMELLSGELYAIEGHESRDLFYEDPHASQEELLSSVRRFKELKGAVFFSVMGGRISEGMDFPGEALELAVLVGIPFPKPTARSKGLRRYYDIKTGDGWLFAVMAPAIRKVLQCMGRIIRSSEDRGVAVILDYRVRRFEEFLEGLEESRDVPGAIRDFFGAGGMR